MKKLFFTFVLLQTVGLFSQQCLNSYSGIILDEHDNTPVLSAKVVFKELNKTYSTDSKGYFKVDSLCTGTHNVLFYHHYGCEPVKKVITIPFVGADTIYLEHHYEEEIAVELNAITIRTVTISKPIQKTYLTIFHIDPLDVQIERGKTWGDLLKTIPGVSTLSSGATIQKPAIHGMYGSRILTLIDGARLEGQQWGSEHSPEVNPFAYERVEVVSGADAVAYGSDAVGGVILTSMNSIPSDRIFGGVADLGYSTNGNQLFGNLKLYGRFPASKKWSWLAQGAYKKAGTLKSPTYFLSNTGMDEVNTSYALNYTGKRWNSHLAYTYYQTNIGMLSSSHVEDMDELYDAFQANTPSVTGKFTYKIDEPALQTKHHLAIWNNQWIINDKNVIELNYSFQANHRLELHDHEGHDHEEGEHEEEEHEEEGMELYLLTNQLSTTYNHSWHNNLNGRIGMNYWNQENQISGEYFIPNYTKNALGLFWIETWSIHPKHILNTGVRYDISSIQAKDIQDSTMSTYRNDYGNLSGTLQYLFRVNHHLNFNAVVGNTWRTPTINELFSNGVHDAIYEKGDRQLETEKALFATVGGKYSSKKWNVQVDVYHYWFYNYINYHAMSSPMVTELGVYPAFEYQQIKATYSGIDFIADYRFTNWLTAVVKGSLVRAYNQQTKAHLSQIPADRLQPSVKFTKAFKNDDKLIVRLGSTLMRRQSKAPVEYGFVKAPKGYALMDVAILYYLNYKRGDVVFSVTADNVLDTKYRDYMNRYRYYANEMGANISFKIQVPF